MLTTAPWLRYFALALVLATSSPAGAADVAVRYLVERDPLRLLPSTAPLVLELHADPLCSALVASQTVSLANVERIVDIKRLRLHGARTAGRVLELRHTFTGLAPVSTLYARVRGEGVVPVGGECQTQTFVPPPTVPRPLVRDANGTVIGVVALVGYAYTGVLRDDGFGVYGIAIGSRIFAALNYYLAFPTPDCSGAPFQPRFFVHELTTQLNGVIYGPGGPVTEIVVRSYLFEEGCWVESQPSPELVVPAIPLDLTRFVPPFRVDHAPTNP